LDDVLTSSGEGLGYPFDLDKLRFYERCLKAEKRVEKLVERCIDAWNRVAIAYDLHEVLKRLYKMVYGSWDVMGKRFAEVKKGSLAAAADKIFDGSNR
jgi:hypothetical protein